MIAVTHEERASWIYNAALTLAPCFAANLDFSNRGPAWGNPGDPNDYEKLADRAFLAAEAFVAKQEALLKKALAKDEAAKPKEAQ